MPERFVHVYRMRIPVVRCLIETGVFPIKCRRALPHRAQGLVPARKLIRGLRYLRLQAYERSQPDA
jgi:hypothetical protein